MTVSSLCLTISRPAALAGTQFVSVEDWGGEWEGRTDVVAGPRVYLDCARGDGVEAGAGGGVVEGEGEAGGAG